MFKSSRWQCWHCTNSRLQGCKFSSVQLPKVEMFMRSVFVSCEMRIQRHITRPYGRVESLLMYWTVEQSFHLEISKIHKGVNLEIFKSWTMFNLEMLSNAVFVQLDCFLQDSKVENCIYLKISMVRQFQNVKIVNLRGHKMLNKWPAETQNILSKLPVWGLNKLGLFTFIYFKPIH